MITRQRPSRTPLVRVPGSPALGRGALLGEVHDRLRLPVVDEVQHHPVDRLMEQEVTPVSLSGMA